MGVLSFASELRRPAATSPRAQKATRHSRIDCAGPASEPGRDGAEHQSNRGEQGASRHRFRGDVGGLGCLLLGLIDRLAVTLLILLHLCASLISRDVLRFRDRLCGSFASVLALTFVASEGGTDRGSCGIAKSCWIIAARGAAN